MNSALWVAKTGLDAQQKHLTVISNNLANVNTVGFKSDRAQFEDLVYQTIQQPGSAVTQNTNAPSGLMLGTGVRIGSTVKNFTDGSQSRTDNPLDIAISGKGFMQVQLPGGSDMGYTRAGHLQLDQTGQLVTMEGYIVQPAITIPPDAQQISIGRDGTVSVITTNAASPQQVGQIQLANFINPTGLQPIGNNLYRETVSSGAPQVGNPNENGLGETIQGALESSNVNVVEGLIELIEAQRAFEVNSKAISTTDQMLQYLNQQT